ncbi:MAG: hypothetical protein PHF53_06605 [Bacteroidales bacterium]|jgi:lipoate-protein ligase A|nr:hypothetical protein [Bacteroidales bacterium]
MEKVYDLPDVELINAEATEPGFMIWIPEQTTIVLGQSNEPDLAVHLDRAMADGVPVLKRSSGGQTVILTPQTVVISVRLISHRLENPQVYFKQINSLIINTLKNIGIKNLDQKGISDITIGEKKILGSSIYRKKSMVFYHAVLNIAEPISSISRYLKHPTREPDYRAGRSHEEFVTSIREAGYPFTPEQVRQALSETFSL